MATPLQGHYRLVRLWRAKLNGQCQRNARGEAKEMACYCGYMPGHGLFLLKLDQLVFGGKYQRYDRVSICVNQHNWCRTIMMFGRSCILKCE